VLERREVIAAFEHRLAQIATAGQHAGQMLETIPHDHEIPAHVAEHVRLTQARLDGEAAWLNAVLARLRSGEYWFEGEPDRPWSSPAYAGA